MSTQPEMPESCRTRQQESGGFSQVPRGCGKLGKKFWAGLDIIGGCSKITNGSALPKSVGLCRGFTVGSEVIQGTDSYSEAPY